MSPQTTQTSQPQTAQLPGEVPITQRGPVESAALESLANPSIEQVNEGMKSVLLKVVQYMREKRGMEIRRSRLGSQRRRPQLRKMRARVQQLEQEIQALRSDYKALTKENNTPNHTARVNLLKQNFLLSRQVVNLHQQKEVLSGMLHTVTQQVNAYSKLRGVASITSDDH